MKKIILIFLFLFYCAELNAQDYKYILNDTCIIRLEELAKSTLKPKNLEIIKDSRGIIIRYNLEELFYNKTFYSDFLSEEIIKIEDFLAKIENPAIIEVHAVDFSSKYFKNKYKNWEITTIIANKIEKEILNKTGRVLQNRIKSVGYGEFLPPKNTPNNGGKPLNRIDIIILCNINGE